jgi:hypothetical protein
MAVDAWWRNEAGQALEELEWCEAKFLATVHVGLGEPVHQASLRRGERLDAAGGVESLEGERPPRTVADEPLQARAVLTLDVDGAVHREAAGAPPRAHVRSRGGIQELAPDEPPQDVRIPTKWPPQSKGSGPGIPEEVAHPMRGEKPRHRSEATLAA